MELDAFFQKHRIDWRCKGLSIGFIAPAVWYDQNPETVILERIRKLRNLLIKHPKVGVSSSDRTAGIIEAGKNRKIG
ncbi:1514_t:CDS:2 [Diversispora eburnea]|uniref:1514_t:CDS:1 n=1 Tax=Diversispora eburnea TaxID=1213867 RepID=A0A9N8W038_9GLOM|nr:1514_t:CDS:2 [Diversispora eburnea]